MQKIGSLWWCKKNGRSYLKGKMFVEDEFGDKHSFSVLIFRNHYKSKGDQPDYIVYRIEPFDSGEEKDVVINRQNKKDELLKRE